MQPLRKWQVEAIDVITSLQKKGDSHALIAACPGSGKTRLTVQLMSDGMGQDCVVIVVPSRALKMHWEEAFRDAGIKAIPDVNNSDLEERRYRDLDLFDPSRPVQIMTYAQVAVNPDLFAALCSRHKVVAVFDEIHHADDDAKFGQSLIVAFSDAIFRLSLSGTPFNTKGGTLAFCKTMEMVDDEGERVKTTIADYTYSYGAALNATGEEGDPMVVRPVSFVRWNGTVEWERVNLDSGIVTKKLFNGKRKSDPLTPFIDPQLDYFKKLLRAALNELEEIRRNHSNAGMLITTMDTDHCEEIASLCRSFGVSDIAIIKFDTPGAQKEIKRFEKGSSRILIAIKMISEGVDIKRLRVGLYASNVLTRMFFTQFIGRFVRWDGSLGHGQHAVVFIPEHPLLIKWAKEIERMVLESAIKDGEGPPPPGPNSVLLNKSGDGEASGVIERGATIEENVHQRIDDILIRAKLKGKMLYGDALSFMDALRYVPKMEPHVIRDDRDFSKINDRLVGKAVYVARMKGLKDMGFDAVNTMANRAVGIHKKDGLTPEADLQKRAEWLRGLILRISSSRFQNDAGA